MSGESNKVEDIRLCPIHGYYRGEKCNCGYTGEIILKSFKVEKLGRLVSGILRHFPDKFGIEMDEDGWVNFNDLVRAVKRKYKWANQWLLKAMIYSDAKGRYELKGDKIRAKYGHSVKVKLSDYPICNKEVLYYGTGEEEAQRLIEIGIKPVNQTFVHLSTTKEKSEEVARLRTDEPIILEVDAKSAIRDGIRIIMANDYIALAEEIPPKYILKMVKLGQKN